MIVQAPSARGVGYYHYTSGLGFNWDALWGGVTAGGTAASQIIRSTQQPYMIPGSNVIYNPATGQALTQTGTTAQQFGAAAAQAASGFTPTAIAFGIGGLVLVLVILTMKR